MISRRNFIVLLGGAAACLPDKPALAEANGSSVNLSAVFKAPPNAARPYVLWMWMGSNISKSGITKDLEAMKEVGIGGVTIFSLADTTTPWAAMIQKSPTPEIVTFTEPWWTMVRHAASEARRLGLEIILHNCAGYESSGGPWITPELSMQEIIWSQLRVPGGAKFTGVLKRATVDPHPHAQFPDVYIPALGKVDKPIVEARKTFYRDIALLAVPAEGVITKEKTLDLSGSMGDDGQINWDAPAGEWVLYRFGHTTTGAMIQPAQWDAMGMECDKLNTEAVSFHVRHVLAGIKEHLGDLAGGTLTTLYFDSYEAGDPTWTPKMREEFKARRGYEITPLLPAFAGRTVGSDAETAHFKQDFKRTVYDLFRDCYWATAARLTREAGLQFGAEPYEGSWDISEVVPLLDRPTAEFWTDNNHYSPVDAEPVINAAHAAGVKIISAEAFTSKPEVSKWTEHPAWLKPIGDAAFCAGINRFSVHHFVHQPWGDQYKPGNTMGQWGIHYGRNQTWWKPGRAWVTYLWRCQALLQRGTFVNPGLESSMRYASSNNGPELKSIHRHDGDADIYFVANVSNASGNVQCSFPVAGKTPELWDPVWGSIRDLADFTVSGGTTSIPIEFEASQSFFIVFRNPAKHDTRSVPNFPKLSAQSEVAGQWDVAFDPRWGGPQSVRFDILEDWTTRREPGIKYYSGTAVYKKRFVLPGPTRRGRVFLDLGTVNHLAEVTLNGADLGVVWTAPWRVEITRAIKSGENNLEIAVTNVWANRMIGDEREPADCTFVPGDINFKAGYYLKEFPDWFLKGEKRPSQGRFTFATWNYFTKDSKLQSSGLLGPVRILAEN